MFPDIYNADSPPPQEKTKLSGQNISSTDIENLGLLSSF